MLGACDGGGLVSDGCGGAASDVHEVVWRWIRDLPILDARTWLMVPRRRVACPSCGAKLERLSWLGRYQRVTRRLAESVARLCRVLPIKHVAAFFGLSRSTVKAIDKRSLEETLGAVALAGVSVIAMDEFAIHKGHRYATVIADPTTKKVLWVGRGHGRRDIRPFFEMLGETGRRNIRAVVMDMNGAYQAEVRLQCPKAEIVFDLFHVVAKYGSEVIDRVRLDELLAANQALMTVYVLRDDLKELWRLRDTEAARAAWQAWLSRATESGIKPLVAFAKRLQPYLHGILAHCRWPLHTSLLEGINNKIKVIKRMAYGFRDDDYFFLKIRAAFLGNR